MATLEETLDKAIEVAVKRALLDAHPVGSIYLTIKDENPSTKFGGTWVKLPSSVCLQTADTSHGAGTTIAAGLPNITGTAQNFLSYDGDGGAVAQGAFSLSYVRQSDFPSGPSANVSSLKITMNAASSNSIYGSSTTVQPPAYALIAWRRTA